VKAHAHLPNLNPKSAANRPLPAQDQTIAWIPEHSEHAAGLPAVGGPCGVRCNRQKASAGSQADDAPAWPALQPKATGNKRFS
jgi:hypothetical protein